MVNMVKKATVLTPKPNQQKTLATLLVLHTSNTAVLFQYIHNFIHSKLYYYIVMEY